MYFIRFHAR